MLTSITRPSSLVQVCGIVDYYTQHLEWSAGDTDAYRIDGMFARNPEHASEQAEKQRIHDQARAEEHDFNTEALVRAESGEEEDLLMLFGSSQPLPTLLPLRDPNDLEYALRGLMTGELQMLPKQSVVRRLLGKIGLSG